MGLEGPHSSPTHGELTIASYLFEISHCCRLEVNVTQDEAALCTKLEGLYDAYGDDGRCLWPGKICERVVEIEGHDALQRQQIRIQAVLTSGAIGPGTSTATRLV